MIFPDDLHKKRHAHGSDATDFTFTMHTIMRLNHLNMLKSSQEIGLSMGQPPVLVLLSLKNQQTQRELCDFLRIKPASMTDVLQRMERDGLIERIRDEKDMRNIRVSLTEKGREKHKEFQEKREFLDTLCFESFTAEEQGKCLEFLNRILNNLNRYTQEKEDEK